MEDLLNSLMEAKEEQGDGYVALAKESAADMFLIRSKVAVFDRKNAKRLKLIDLGGDLND